MSYTHVSQEEREEISRGLASGTSLHGIAERLRRDPGTISRELSRNAGGDRERYRAGTAGRRARRRAMLPRRQRELFRERWLWGYVTAKLREDWSPEEISARLRRDYPRDMAKRISHEAIYQALYILPRGTLRQELLAHLRLRHRKRRKRGLIHDRRGRIPHMVSIHERPRSVEERRVPGHWEGDLLVGRNHQSAIGVLVERASRLTLLSKLRGQDAAEVRRAFARAFQSLPSVFRRTLTYDRGKEMTEHETLAREAAIRVFFCDPQSPWQRGTNENTNGLLRQYFPKGTDLSAMSSRELRRVTRLLNTRPRKVLDFRTPEEVWREYQRRRSRRHARPRSVALKS